MTRTLLYLLVSVFLFNYLLADGPPIDSTGKIYTKYVAIHLDSNQIEHLQNHRWLKLTDAQQKRLSYLTLPKYIDVLDPFHNDCTCGQIYGMWFKPDSLAFVVKDSTKKIKYDKNDEVFNSYNSELAPKENLNDLYIGINGQLYYMNKIIDVNYVREIIKELKPKKGDEIHLKVYQPPVNYNVNASKILITKKKLRKIIPSNFILVWL